MSGFDTTVLRSNLMNANPASPAYFELGFSALPAIFNKELWGDRPDLRDRFQKIASIRHIRDEQSWIDNFADFRFRCMATDLPSRQIETQERRYSGPQRLIPYGIIYNNLNVELIEGKNLRMREIIDVWMDMIYGASFELGGSDMPTPAYYDDIIGEMLLKVYAKSGEVVRSYKFRDVFPVTVAPSQLSWSGDNQILTIPVEFSYYDFVGTSDFDNSRMIGNRQLLR